MSNLDTRPAAQQLGGLEATSAGPALDLLPGKEVLLGESTRVRRLLPTLGRRMVGAWAFVDHYGPDDVAAGAGMQVAPHPHTGLQTVSWLLEGRVHHRDSLGSDVEFGPGELALMTAGHGIAHAEQSPSSAPAVPARRPAVGGAPRRRPGDRAGVRAPRDPARLHLRRRDDDGAHGLLRRGDVAGHRVHAAGRGRPGPGRRRRRRGAAGTGLRVRAARLVRLGDGGGRTARARLDALPRHRPPVAAPARRRGQPAAAAGRRAVRRAASSCGGTSSAGRARRSPTTPSGGTPRTSGSARWSATTGPGSPPRRCRRCTLGPRPGAVRA